MSDSSAQPGAAGAERSYLGASSGLLSWVFTKDHKRIGMMYLASILLFFLVGGMLALMVRLELLTPGGDLIERRHLQQDRSRCTARS